MSRTAAPAPLILLLAVLAVACSPAAPEPTATPTIVPTTATAFPTASPTATPTARPTIILPVTSTLPPVTLALPATVAPTPCAPREDWGGRYEIQAGDSLFTIAQRHETGIRELQLGNCIPDADFIQAGQILFVPGPGATATATPQATGAITLSPAPPVFIADQGELSAGACTILRWEVENVDAVYFEGTAVSKRGIREVCPERTTRYTLLLLQQDGAQVPHIVVVEVRPA